MKEDNKQEQILFSTRSFRPFNWGIIILSYCVLMPLGLNVWQTFFFPFLWVYPLVLFEIKYAIFYQGHIEFRYPLNPLESVKSVKYSAIIELKPLPSLRRNTRFQIVFMKGKKREMATIYPYSKKVRAKLLPFLKEQKVKVQI